MNFLDRTSNFLLLNPPSPDKYVYIRDINRSGRRSRECTIWPQSSLACLAAVVKKIGYDPNILDCIASNLHWNDVQKYIKQHCPKWILIEGISSTITNDLYASYIGKRYGAKTILVGPHITALPTETMNAFPSLDYGIIGEVEETLGELVHIIDTDGDIASVTGIAFRDGDRIAITPQREFIKDLDLLPLPLYELLPIEKYYAPYIGGPYVFVLHSRGCPNSCYFCRQNIMWRSVCRLRTGKSIANEFLAIAKLGIKKVMFHSDTFTQNKENVLDICRHLIQADTGIRWLCNGRVDLVDAEMLQIMRVAGCDMINYGIESGSQDILALSNKGENATPDRAIEAVQMTKAAGIAVWGYFMIGLPGETKASIRQTVAFAKQLPIDLVNFSIATPYPGTPFFKTASANGWLQKVDWEDFDQNYSTIVNYPALSDKDIIAGVRYAYMRWFATPKGFMTFLKALTSWRNLKVMLRVALNHLSIR
jgi:radical SAM superfamily enzyme YgiQ (UPF0313 family)